MTLTEDILAKIEAAKDLTEPITDDQYDRNAALDEAAQIVRTSAQAARAYIDVVFDGPPAPKSGRFVEVEDPQGRGLNAGEWVPREDGLWALRVRPEVFEK